MTERRDEPPCCESESDAQRDADRHRAQALADDLAQHVPESCAEGDPDAELVRPPRRCF